MLKFISLLGTSRYIPCNYYLEDRKVYDCCYIQQALIEILEKQGVIPDEIVIFTTEEAHKKNWDKNEFNKTRLGLGGELNSISAKIDSEINEVAIPSGQNEDEVWKLFEIILEELEDGDEIILDITHSFRYLPMLTFIVINYARIVKKCKLNAIYYGAFETLGNYQDVGNMPLENRNAPIFDLTPFVQLFDWTIGIDRYLATGNVSIIDELTKSEIKRINEKINKNISKSEMLENPAILFEDPNALKELSNSMRQFSDAVFTCRGQELTAAVSLLKSNIGNVVESTAHGKIKPLAPIMGMLKERFDKFSVDDDYINIIETAKWCLNNGMYQQGFTILEEGLINYVCTKWDLDILETRNRKWVTGYAYMVAKNNLNPDHTLLNMDQKKANDLFTLLYNIGDIRNDINHAGWRKAPSLPKTFASKLELFINRAESILYRKNIVYDNLSDRQMLLIFSHELTNKQRKEAIERFGISRFVILDDVLLDKWKDVPPHLENLSDYLSDIIEWIDRNGKPGDYALVQGDYGATIFIIDFCMSKNITPVYATTERKVIEDKTGETVKLSREFKHVMFREY